VRLDVDPPHYPGCVLLQFGHGSLVVEVCGYLQLWQVNPVIGSTCFSMGYVARPLAVFIIARAALRHAVRTPGWRSCHLGLSAGDVPLVETLAE
jgi:hypothetical protein